MTMPSTTSYKFGDVVLVSFPFTDHQSMKKRPAVIISSKAYTERCPDVILLAITSRVDKPSEFGQCLIGNWHGAGLIKSSAFKPLIATIEQGAVIRKLGILSQSDLQNLDTFVDSMLGSS